MVNVDPLRKAFPNLFLGKEPPRPNVLTKLNSPHGEMFPPMDGPLRKVVLTHVNLKPPDVLVPQPN